MTRTLDLMGAQVKLTFKGRTLLGDVRRTFVREFPYPMTMAEVYHFNGEPWPVFPVSASILTVLPR